MGRACPHCAASSAFPILMCGTRIRCKFALLEYEAQSTLDRRELRGFARSVNGMEVVGGL